MRRALREADRLARMNLFGPRRAETPSDEQAMRAIQRGGDSTAFAALVSRWEAPIRRLCTRMTSDEHRAEDLAQETFVRVFAHRHRFDPEQKFSTWMWRIAINLCNEENRRRAVRNEFESLRRRDGPGLGDVGESDPAHRAAASERADLVRRALAQLSEELRAVVVLREYEQLKFREVAEVLDVPEGTVKWRMSEAMTQLAGMLKPLLAEETPTRRVSQAKVRLAT